MALSLVSTPPRQRRSAALTGVSGGFNAVRPRGGMLMRLTSLTNDGDVQISSAEWRRLGCPWTGSVPVWRCWLAG